MDFFKDFIEKVKLYVKVPDEKSSKEKLKETISTTLTYASIFVFSSSLLNGFMSYLFINLFPSQLSQFYNELTPYESSLLFLIVISPIISVIFHILFTAIYCLLQKVVALIFSVDLSFQDLFKITVFSSTPLYLAGFFQWIPCIGLLTSLIASFVSIYYLVKTISIITKISTLKALAIVILSLIASLVLIFILLFLFSLFSAFYGLFYLV